MAYGMPMPSVAFPYFYPTKLPTSIPPASNTNSMHPDVKPHFYLKHLSTPLNFSKRETEEQIDGERRNFEIEKHDGSCKTVKQESDQNEDSGDCQMTNVTEENENVEIE
jgi:hypothetical protein